MTERERLIEMIDNSNACICVDVDKITDYIVAKLKEGEYK